MNTTEVNIPFNHTIKKWGGYVKEWGGYVKEFIHKNLIIYKMLDFLYIIGLFPI